MHVLFWRETPFDATQMALVDDAQALWRLELVRPSMKRSRKPDWSATILQPRLRGALRDGAVLVSLRGERSEEALPSEACIIATHPLVVFTREDARLDAALARLNLRELASNYRTRSSDKFAPLVVARDVAGQLQPITQAWWLETFGTAPPLECLRVKRSPREAVFWQEALEDEDFHMDAVELPIERRLNDVVNHEGWDFAVERFFRGYTFTQHYANFSHVVPSELPHTGPCFFCGQTKELQGKLAIDGTLWIGSTCARQFALVLRYFDFIAEVSLAHDRLATQAATVNQTAERLAAHYRILDDIQL